MNHNRHLRWTGTPAQQLEQRRIARVKTVEALAVMSREFLAVTENLANDETLINNICVTLGLSLDSSHEDILRAVKRAALQAAQAKEKPDVSVSQVQAEKKKTTPTAEDLRALEEYLNSEPVLRAIKENAFREIKRAIIDGRDPRGLNPMLAWRSEPAGVAELRAAAFARPVGPAFPAGYANVGVGFVPRQEHAIHVAYPLDPARNYQPEPRASC